MKTLVLILFTCIVISPFVSATSGRTDSSGCHNSKKAGYHCHGSSSSSAYKSTYRSTAANNSKSTNTSKSTYQIKESKKSFVDNGNMELIKAIQIQLNALGFSAGKPDGILGKKTIGAIKSFQRKFRLNVDGEPSHELLLELLTVNK